MELLNLLIFILVSWPNVKANDQCRTLNGEIGSCININDCKPLNDLNKKKRKTDDDLLVLRQSSCGMSSNFKPQVCCPDRSLWPNYTTKPIDLPKPVYPKPPFDPKEKTPVRFSNTSATSFDNEKKEYCGLDNANSDRITGGQIASIDQYPWLALMEYQGGATGCGGSLISANFVLTAAHCINTKYGLPIRVRLSEYNTSTPIDVVLTSRGYQNISVFIVAVEKATVHPEYRKRPIAIGGSRSVNDIGLVKLASNAPYTDFIRPICLPSWDITQALSQNKINFIVAGWGSDGSQYSSEVRKHVTLPYIRREECQQTRQEQLEEGQICAGGENGKDSCSGDSGGPLMFEMGNFMAVVGIVSFGDKVCGREGVPAVYTHVFKYLDWIREEMMK